MNRSVSLETANRAKIADRLLVKYGCRLTAVEVFAQTRWNEQSLENIQPIWLNIDDAAETADSGSLCQRDVSRTVGPRLDLPHEFG